MVSASPRSFIATTSRAAPPLPPPPFALRALKKLRPIRPNPLIPIRVAIDVLLTWRFVGSWGLSLFLVERRQDPAQLRRFVNARYRARIGLDDLDPHLI